MGGGYHVRVVDLALLATMEMGNSRVVLEFWSSRSQPSADLRFSKDGCSCYSEGRASYHGVSLRPTPAVLFGGRGAATSPHDYADSQTGSGSMRHLYDLRRGG